jgi:hypothetical protein
LQFTAAIVRVSVVSTAKVTRGPAPLVAFPGTCPLKLLPAPTIAPIVAGAPIRRRLHLFLSALLYCPPYPERGDAFGSRNAIPLDSAAATAPFRLVRVPGQPPPLVTVTCVQAPWAACWPGRAREQRGSRQIGGVLHDREPPKIFQCWRCRYFGHGRGGRGSVWRQRCGGRSSG